MYLSWPGMSRTVKIALLMELDNQVSLFTAFGTEFVFWSGQLNYIAGDDDNSKSKWLQFTSSPLIIPSVVVLASIFGLSCFLRLLKLTTDRRDTETGDNMNSTNSESTTTRATPASPNEANNRVGQSPTGNRPCIETIVVDDIHSISLPNAETISCCSICLEDYQERDTVRYLSQCGHYFHAQCVDKWLHKNTTCPVCRDKLSASNL